jgi:transcriptional regulator with PAS, ATPase and Fis domain
MVGDTKVKKIDVRVIAATSRNLKDEVSAGAFRKDLFYRLNVLPIRLSLLRERTEDILLLGQYFIDRFNIKLGKNVKGIPPAAIPVRDL